jgi:hypothetical protein
LSLPCWNRLCCDRLARRRRTRGATDRPSGQFAVHFTTDVTPKSTGRRVTLEEVGLYTVKDDQITREQFFYEGER